MLIYRYSEPFFVFAKPVSRRPIDYPDDTLRWLLHDIMNYEICCRTSINSMLADGLLPSTMQGIPTQYNGSLHEYELMLATLSDFRLFCILKREDDAIDEIITDLTRIVIKVSNNKLYVRSTLEDLTEHIKSNCEDRNMKFIKEVKK